MSWRRVLASPIADRHRVQVFCGAVAVLALAAAALFAIPDGGLGGLGNTAPPPPRPSTPPARSRPLGPGPQIAARRFLHDYLPFVAGRRAGSGFASAAPALARQLGADRPLVASSPAGRPARILKLERHELGPGSVAVTAEVAAAGGILYTLDLTVERRVGGWFVTAIGSD